MSMGMNLCSTEVAIFLAASSVLKIEAFSV